MGGLSQSQNNYKRWEVGRWGQSCKVKGLVAWCHSFYLIGYHTYYSFTHSYIHEHSPRLSRKVDCRILVEMQPITVINSLRWQSGEPASVDQWFGSSPAPSPFPLPSVSSSLLDGRHTVRLRMKEIYALCSHHRWPIYTTVYCIYNVQYLRSQDLLQPLVNRIVEVLLIVAVVAWVSCSNNHRIVYPSILFSYASRPNVQERYRLRIMAYP